MIIPGNGPMAHRRGRRVRLEHRARVAGRASAALVTRAASRFTFGRPRSLALVAFLLIGASAVPFLTGSAGGASSALAAMPAAQVPGAAAAPTPAASPTIGAGAAASVVSTDFGSAAGSPGIDPLDLIVKGIVVGVLLYLTLRVLRRVQAGPAGGPHRLEILETRPLGPKASLFLVAVGERRLVVGLSPGGIVSIADVDPAELTAQAGARDGAPFASGDRAPFAAGRGSTPADGSTAVLGLVRAGFAGVRGLLSGRPGVIADARSQASRRGTLR